MHACDVCRKLEGKNRKVFVVMSAYYDNQTKESFSVTFAKPESRMTWRHKNGGKCICSDCLEKLNIHKIIEPLFNEKTDVDVIKMEKLLDNLEMTLNGNKTTALLTTEVKDV